MQQKAHRVLWRRIYVYTPIQCQKQLNTDQVFSIKLCMCLREWEELKHMPLRTSVKKYGTWHWLCKYGWHMPLKMYRCSIITWFWKCSPVHQVMISVWILFCIHSCSNFWSMLLKAFICHSRKFSLFWKLIQWKKSASKNSARESIGYFLWT